MQFSKKLILIVSISIETTLACKTHSLKPCCVICTMFAFRYYLIDGLRQQLETHLQDLDEQLPICRVPVITSIEEEQKILSKSNKVA